MEFFAEPIVFLKRPPFFFKSVCLIMKPQGFLDKPSFFEFHKYKNGQLGRPML